MAAKKKRASAKKPKPPVLRDPLTGKFVRGGVGVAKRLEAKVVKAYRKAQRDRNRAARKRFGGAKKVETQRKQNRVYREAAKKAARLSEKLDKATKQRSKAESERALRPKARKKAVRVIEVGINYTASKGPASDVNFNIRITRTDGGGVSISDARRALDALATGNENEMPDDLNVTAVDWASPSRVSGKTGQMREKHNQKPDNVFSFSSIISTVLAENIPLRIGEVKEDRIGL